MEKRKEHVILHPSLVLHRDILTKSSLFTARKDRNHPEEQGGGGVRCWATMMNIFYPNPLMIGEKLLCSQEVKRAQHNYLLFIE